MTEWLEPSSAPTQPSSQSLSDNSPSSNDPRPDRNSYPESSPSLPLFSEAPPHQRVVTGADYLRLPRAPETWLVEQLIPTGGSALLYGDPKVGKSFAALQLASSLVSATPWLGLGCPNEASVVYVQLDTPRSLWAERVGALRRLLPTDQVHFADLETLETYPFDILRPDHEELLRGSLAPIAPKAVIIDTLRECHSGDENDSTEMQRVIAHLSAAVKPAAMILVSHSRKPNPEFTDSVVVGNRGSNYVTGRMDAIMHLADGRLTITGRALEETKIHLEKIEIPGGFIWDITTGDKNKKLAQLLLTDARYPSLRAKARVMAEQTGTTLAGCLSTLHRLNGVSKGVFHEANLEHGETGLSD